MDARKSLETLQEEWSACRACDLGGQREARQAPFFLGTGKKGGIMFIVNAPSQEEEEAGMYGVGDANRILLDTLARLNFEDFYITGLTACRAATPSIDPETGLPRMRRQRNGPDQIVYYDGPPSPPAIKACQSRLHEEIYIVDPVLIVTLGVTVSEAMLGHKVAITYEHGRTEHIFINGVTYHPLLTEKRKAWVRKVGGVTVQPVARTQVRYLVLPTLDPGYVARKISDQGPGSPFALFAADIKLAVGIYDRYRAETK